MHSLVNDIHSQLKIYKLDACTHFCLPWPLCNLQNLISIISNVYYLFIYYMYPPIICKCAVFISIPNITLLPTGNQADLSGSWCTNLKDK